ncbi:MAG: hypothetical protein IJX25_00665, partial [Clostridia bacterium]|nr:hypothetical protein [Clostridia bacterium]
MKLNKETAGFVFIIVILVALLGLSIYLGMSGWYFYSEENYTTDLQLGKTVQASIKDNQASALSLNIEGSFLPGEWLPQVVAVKNTNDSGA